MTIARLNERALAAAGLDRETIRALQHILTQAGQSVGATTLPEVAETVDSNLPAIEALRADMTTQQTLTAALSSDVAALPVMPESTYEMHLETQIRALAEMISELQKEVDGLKQGPN